MKTVIYARYSSHSQTEQSIEGQLRDCYEYAKNNNLTIVDTYIDRAITGTMDEREQFQRMIKDSEKHTFEAVLTWKMDRFARNRYDSAMYKARLKKNNIKLFYAKENIPEGPEGIILESLLEGMAEYYSEELKIKVRRGMKESAMKCKYTGGILALGYKSDSDKNILVDDDAALIVVKIFNMYNDGMSTADICNNLNSLGYLTAKKKPFNKNSLRKILANRKYIGIYQYGDVEIENGIPALVDLELFNNVQEKLKVNKTTLGQKKKAKTNYLLSGKLFCGKCKSNMNGESGTSSNKEKHNYYKCFGRKIKKICDCEVVKKEWIENLVAEETVKNILNDETIDLIADKCIEIQLNDKSSVYESELKDLKKQLSATTKSIDNLIVAIEQGIITKTTKARLNELEEQKEKIEFEIKLAEIKTPNLSKEHIKFMINRYSELDIEYEEDKEELINCFVNCVEYYNDKIIICYNLTDKNNAPVCSTSALVGGASYPLSEQIYIINTFLFLEILKIKKS